MSVIRPFAALIAGLSLLLPAVAPAEPATHAFDGLPKIMFRSYKIHGRTAAEIFASLRASGLGEQGNATTTGLTQWRASFNWDVERGPFGCRTLAPRTTVDVIVTLPRLKGADRATPEGLAAWRSYLTILERHEAGHARIAFAHARDFERDAQGARCEDIAAIGQRVTDRVTALQEDYDRRTNHGQAQGNILE